MLKEDRAHIVDSTFGWVIVYFCCVPFHGLWLLEKLWQDSVIRTLEVILENER